MSSDEPGQGSAADGRHLTVHGADDELFSEVVDDRSAGGSAGRSGRSDRIADADGSGEAGRADGPDHFEGADRSEDADPFADAVQYLAPDGTPLPDVDLPAIDDDTLLEIYEWLVLARRLDERAHSLQRQGRIATWAPMTGQEGSQVASAVAMADGDWVYPTYREHAAKVVRGTEPAALLARLRGNDAPADFEVGRRVFPESIPVASHLPHAVGCAAASSYRGRDEAHVVHFGDGATSQGDFHEACNFAGVLDVPVVFLCHDNGWAISTPTARQTASDTLAGKAAAYGFDGVRVDGMDPLAVHDVTSRALQRVREGVSDGPRPLLVEAVEYRLGAHTTADDPAIYRGDVPDRWQERDPVPRFEGFLRTTGRLDDETVATVADRVDATLADAIDRVEALEATPAGLFEHVYEEPTPRLEDQRAELRRRRGGLDGESEHRR